MGMNICIQTSHEYYHLFDGRQSRKHTGCLRLQRC
jgi:hypothetical protein